MAFVFFVFFHGKQIHPNAVTALCFAGLFSVTIAYSAVIWWLFERNTDDVRLFIESQIAQLSETDFIPGGACADWLMSWLPVRRALAPLHLGTATMRSILSSRASCLREWWGRVLLCPRPTFAHSSLYPILFMLLFYRILPEMNVPTDRTSSERTQQQVLVLRASSRSTSPAVDAI
jgi:hypothetical protein